MSDGNTANVPATDYEMLQRFDDEIELSLDVMKVLIQPLAVDLAPELVRQRLVPLLMLNELANERRAQREYVTYLTSLIRRIRKIVPEPKRYQCELGMVLTLLEVRDRYAKLSAVARELVDIERDQWGMWKGDETWLLMLTAMANMSTLLLTSITEEKKLWENRAECLYQQIEKSREEQKSIDNPGEHASSG